MINTAGKHTPSQQNISMYLENIQQKDDCKLMAEAGVKTTFCLQKACKMAALGMEVLLSCF